MLDVGRSCRRAAVLGMVAVTAVSAVDTPVLAEGLGDVGDSGSGGSTGGSGGLVGIEGVGLAGSLVGGSVSGGVLVSGGGLGLRLSGASLVEGVEVLKVGLLQRSSSGGEGDEYVVESNEGVIPLSGFMNNGYSEYTVTVYLSNGQRLLVDLYDVVPELADVTQHIEDTTKPVIEFSSADWRESNGYVNGDGTAYFLVSDSESGVSSAVMSMEDGSELEYAFDSETNIISFNTAQFEKGTHSIVITAVDKAGNEETYGYSFKIMRMAPEVAGASHTAVVVEGGKSYYKGVLGLELSGCGNPDIERILVHVGSGENAVDYPVNLGDGSVEISGSGECSVEVIDKAGNNRIYALSQLFEGISDILVEDSEVPIASVVVEPELDWSNNENPVVITLGAEDNELLSKVILSVNGVTNEIECSGSSFNEVLDLSGYDKPEDGVYTIELKSVDVLGNESEVATAMVKVDTEIPSIQLITYEGTLREYNDVVYINDSLSITINAEDKPSGVKKVELFKDGDLVGEVDGTFTIEESGSYILSVTDVSGNCVSAGLGSLLSLESEDFIVDAGKPTVFATLNGSESFTTWVTGEAVLGIESSDDTVLESIVTIVNGVSFERKVNSDSTSFELDLLNAEGLEEPEDGIYNISIVVTDILGNQETKEYTVKLDSSAPEVGSIKVEGIHKLINNKIYIKDGLNITCNPEDDKSGIQKVELFKDGEVVQDGMEFEITEPGRYSIRVTNNVGLVSEKPLGLLMGYDVNELLVDNNAPLVSALLNGNEITEKWVVNDALLSVSFSDNVELHSANITVNGERLSYQLNGDSDIVEVDLSELPKPSGGVYNISVSAVDSMGNVSDSVAYRVKADFDAPSIDDVHVEGIYREYNNNVYVNGSISIGCATSDVGSGIKSLELLKDGIVVSSGERLVVDESGSYSIRVTDNAGLSTTYELKDLLRVRSNNIIVDSTPPENVIQVNNSDVTTAWVTNNAVLKVVFRDNCGLTQGTVNINGKVFNYTIDNKLAHEVEIDLKTAVPRAADGKYKVSVSSKDLVGIVSVLENVTVNADFDAPSMSGLSAKGSYVEYDGKVYVDGGITVSGSVSDIGSGVKKVELIKGTEVVASKLPFRIVNDGSYAVRVEDNAGLVTVKSISSFLGTKSDILVHDNEMPSIKRKSGFKPDLVQNKEDWYKTYPSFQYIISDAHMKSVKITLNGEERGAQVGNSTTYSVNTKGIAGRVQLKVEAVDCYGHKSVDSYVYYVDRSAPKVSSIKFSEEYKARGGYLFFSKAPKLLVSAKETGVGMKEFVLSNGKNKEYAIGSSSAMFKLSTGEYKLQITDKLGNSTGLKTLKDLMGLPTNKIIVDKEKPKIKVEKPTGRVNGWYAGDVGYAFNLSDNQGISSAVIKINGVEVGKFKASAVDLKSHTMKVNTSSVKPAEGGLYTIEAVVYDNAGNKRSWSDSFRIDKKSPKVDKFVFTGEGVQEGKEIGGGKSYGFYFKGSAECDIYVSDGSVSSGVDTVYVGFETAGGGGAKLVKYQVVNGVARVKLPNNFKGTIVAYAVDSVGHKGKEARPDGVVTEDSNCFINNTKVDIQLPETAYKDLSGVPLYSSGVSVNAVVASNHAGLRTVEWGIGKDLLGSIYIDNNGALQGSTADIKQKDKNLVIDMLKSIPVDMNTNNIEVWVKVRDRAGYESRQSRIISIDRDVPEVSVSYNVSGSDCYNQTRVANIQVKERNFDPSKFQVSGEGGSLGSWVNSGETWSNTLTFDSDGVYQFSLSCEDGAGNRSAVYSSETFTIDKTAPSVSVSWDSESPNGGGFYRNRRVANITVSDTNFSSDRMVIETNGSLGTWVSSGGVHSCSVSFDGSGEYHLSVKGSDSAGNEVSPYESGSFIIDTVAPELSIEGVQEGISYKDDVSLSVKMSDDYLDTDSVSVTLSGKRRGGIPVAGTVDSKTGEFTFNDFPKEAKYDDIYTLRVEATDKAGNVSEDAVVFSVNRFGSSYEFLDNKILNSYLSQPQSVVIKETNVDKIDLNKVRVVVFLDGKEIEVPEGLILKESAKEKGKYSYTYTIDAKAFSKDGKYLVQVYSSSKDGTAYSSVKEEYAFVLDTTPPEVIISGVEDNGKYYEYNRDVAIDIRDLTGVDTIDIQLNGKSVDCSPESGIYSFKVSESGKSQNLSITVVDKAGNQTVKEVSNFMVSSSTWVYLINQSWFKWGIGGFAALLAALIALIANSRRGARRAEEEALREHAELYRASSSSSSSLGSADTKDEAEDLER